MHEKIGYKAQRVETTATSRLNPRFSPLDNASIQVALPRATSGRGRKAKTSTLRGDRVDQKIRSHNTIGLSYRKQV